MRCSRGLGWRTGRIIRSLSSRYGTYLTLWGELRNCYMDTYAGIGRYRMAGLKDEFRSRAVSRRVTGLDRALAQLSADEQKELIEVIRDPLVPLVAISQVMRKRGITLSTHTIRKARSGEIPCGD